MKRCKEHFKKMVNNCFEGELTMPKINFWLIGLLCLLSGIVYGLMAAPWTHGVHIACNNGNNNGNSNASMNGHNEGEEEEEIED